MTSLALQASVQEARNCNALVSHRSRRLRLFFFFFAFLRRVAASTAAPSARRSRRSSRPAAPWPSPGCVAVRSFASPMSSARLNSSRLRCRRCGDATSFQSPLRIAHCSPNRQYSVSCGRPVVLAGQVRQQVDAVELPRRVDLAAGGGDGRRQDVELDDRVLVRLAGRDLALPLHAERHADAAFQRRRLEAAQRAVVRGRLRASARRCRRRRRSACSPPGPSRGPWPAPGRPRRPSPTSSPRTSAASRPAMFGKRSRYFFGRLQRGVLGVERQVQEERLVLVLADPVDGPLGVGVGGVEVRRP